MGGFGSGPKRELPFNALSKRGQLRRLRADEGHVYVGVCLSPAEFAAFKRVRADLGCESNSECIRAMIELLL